MTNTSVYNGDGLRTSYSYSGTTRNFTWDVAGGLPNVLQDEIYTYVYGLDLISATDSGGTQTYLHYDGLGSTVNLTDGAGTVFFSYWYDVFGGIRHQSGAGPANFWQFTGERRDSGSGLYYLRARHYDPGSGRFLSQDPFSGFAGSSASQNRYVYAINNPVLLVDPYGLLGFPKVPDPVGAVKNTVATVANISTEAHRVGGEVLKAAAPYVIECAIWGAGAGLATAGNPGAAAAACAAGAGAKLFSDFVSNDPISQCVIAGIGGAVAGGFVGASKLGVGGATCVGGALSWLNQNKLGGDSRAACLVWGGTGLVASAFDKSPRLLTSAVAGVAGCVAGIASDLNSWSANAGANPKE